MTAACPPALPTAPEVSRRARAENFPVASRFLPRNQRVQLLAIYAYARLVDEVGDAYPGDRSQALGRLSAELEGALNGPLTRRHPVVVAAAETAMAAGADPETLRDLIRANQADQEVSRYATFSELEAYCRLSANPVGRLVLAVLGERNRECEKWSDFMCTGLQLAEHCQDIVEDRAADRVYVPSEDMGRFGVDEGELMPGSGPAGPRLRALVAFEVARARRFLREGHPLIGALRGRSRIAVAGFAAGGHAALDALAAQDFDPHRGPGRPSRVRFATRACELLVGAGA